MIEIAKSKHYSRENVDFKIAGLFQLTETNKYENLFGGFIWSHIKLQDLTEFIKCSSKLVESGGTVVFNDNNYVEGSSQTVTDTDDYGNTYQTRNLEDGTTHQVLKNFPTKEFVQHALGDYERNIDFVSLQYYWVLKYKTT